MINVDIQALKTWREEHADKNNAQFLVMANGATIEKHEPVSTVVISAHLMETFSHLATAQEPLTIYNVLSDTYRPDSGFAKIVRLNAENIIDLSTGVERALSLHDNPKYGQQLSLLVSAGRLSTQERQIILNLGRSFKTPAQEKLGEDITVTQQDLNIAALLPKIGRIDQAIAELQDARRAMQDEGLDADLTARGIE